MLAMIQFSQRQHRFLVIMLGAITLTAFGSGLELTQLQGLARLTQLRSSVAVAQQPQTRIVRIRDVWQQVYQQMPDLPKENEYISLDTGEVAQEDTLIGRLVRYHVYVKGRSPLSRFDWKLTLADYLGINEVMLESQYPGANSLNQNPLDGDREMVRAFNRSQRQELVNTLVNSFNPNPAESASGSSSSSSEDRTQAPRNQQPSLPPVPQPGDAELLQF